MEEGNVLVGSRHASEIRWLLQAGLLVFTITVAIGILNGFHFITLPRQVLLTLELASKTAFLPEGAIGGHVTAQVVGYLVLIGMAISEWRLKNTPGLTWPGIVQVGLLFLGGILITIGALLNVQALLGAFIPAELIAVIIYCVRLGPQLRRVNWLAPNSERHLGLVVPYLVINLILLVWLITGVVTKVYARFELIPIWLVFAFDHTMFIGVMSNSLFGLIQQASRARQPFWP